MTQYFNMGRRHYLYLAENNILLLSVPEITSVYILLTLRVKDHFTTISPSPDSMGEKTAPALSSEYGRWEILKNQIDAARNHLRDVVGWEKYKSTFIKDLAWHQQEGFLYLGTFSLVRLYQLNSRSIETRDEFIPKLEFSPRETISQAKASDGIPVTPTRSKKVCGQ
ncbi:unnamed protein product [Penicillium nalgiovense]|nr:unnamed protein product [Penicillium nalgiovense]